MIKAPRYVFTTQNASDTVLRDAQGRPVLDSAGRVQSTLVQTGVGGTCPPTPTPAPPSPAPAPACAVCPPPGIDGVAGVAGVAGIAGIAGVPGIPGTPGEPCPPCPECPDPRVTTTPPNLENGFGIVSLANIPGLTDVVIHGTNVGYGVDIQFQTDLVSISVPDLVLLDVNFVVIGNNPALVSVSLPALTTLDNAGYLQVFLTPSLTSVNLSAFTTLDNGSHILVSDSPAPTSFSLPALTTVDNGAFFDVTNNTSLASVSLGSAIFGDGTSYNFSGNALTDVSVNHILALGVANPAYVSGTINLSGGTSSAPTGQGIVDKATLIGRGVAVNTN